FHERVCVAAGNEVNAVDLRRNQSVAVLSVVVIAKVRHADDEGTTLFFTQSLHNVTRSNNRIDVGDAFEIVWRDERDRTDTQSKQPDTNSGERFHNITFHTRLEHG